MTEQTNSKENSQIEQDIVALIAEKIQPAVAMDGGMITFDSFKNGVVYVRLEGACVGCPGAQATLKHGVEALLKEYIPEVEEVVGL
ncbi:MAG: NifU family protein [Alphaproteobacteria bacterium]